MRRTNVSEPVSPPHGIDALPPAGGDRAAARRQSPNSLKTKLIWLAWAAVQATLFRPSFHSWSGWRATLLRLFGATIAPHCTIRRTCRVHYPWNLTMKRHSCLGDRVEVYNLGKVTLGERVTISQEAYLCAGTHDHTRLSMPLLTPPILIKDDAWLCARCFIYPGVTIGRGAVVAACGVVIKDVEDWAMVGGNPAKFLKKREMAAGEIPGGSDGA